MIIAGATKHHVSAGTSHDVIVLTFTRIRSGDRTQHTIDIDRPTIIAHNHIAEITARSINDVLAHTTKHNVITSTRDNPVLPTALRRRSTNRHQTRDTATGIKDRNTVIANHNVLSTITVASGLSINHIVTRTTKHDVGVITSEDEIITTILRGGSHDHLKQRHAGACLESGLTVVANNNVVVIIGAVLHQQTSHQVQHIVDQVVTRASHNQVVAFADQDDVVATDTSCSRYDRGQHRCQPSTRADQVEGDRTVVAEDYVDAVVWVGFVLGINDVVAATGQHDVVALVYENQIVAAVFRSDCFDEGDHRNPGCGLEGCSAVVANDHVDSGVTVVDLYRLVGGVECVVDPVAAATGDNNIVALADNDLIDTIEVSWLRDDAGDQWRAQHRCGVEVNLTVITQHHVGEVTNARMDDVVTGTTENNVVALVYENQIVAAVFRSDCFDEGDHRNPGCGLEGCSAVVANDHVDSGVTVVDLYRLVGGVECVVDPVAAATGDNNIVALADNDLIDGTDVGVGRSDLAEDTDLFAGHRMVIERYESVVAEHDVVAIARSDRVGIGATDHNVDAVGCRDVVGATDCGSDGGSCGDQTLVEGHNTRVTNDDVVAGASVDLVATGATEDDVVGVESSDVLLGLADHDVDAVDKGWI